MSLDGVTGIEVENGNAEAYAKALQKLASDSALREEYGRAAKKRVEDLFTEEVFQNKINQIVSSLS